MHPGEITKVPMVVVIYEFSKSYFCDDGKQCKDQMRDDLFTNEEAIKILVEDDDIQIYGNDGRYPKKKWCMPI